MVAYRLKRAIHLAGFMLFLIHSSSWPPRPFTDRQLLIMSLHEHGVPNAYIEIVADAIEETGVPVRLFSRLIAYESGWNPKAVGINKNGTKDRGIAQLNSAYIHSLEKHNAGAEIDPHDPAVALPVAARHLAWLYEQTGSWWGAIMSYNAGLPRFQKRDIPHSTIKYVQAILDER